MENKDKYPKRWKMDYIPSYYEKLTEEQQRDQHIVLDFKEGQYDEDIILWFQQNIWKMTEGNEYSWSVCFMSCSSNEEQKKRFGKLADYLKKNTRVEIHLSTFGYTEKRDSSHQVGKTDIDIKNIALNVPDIFAKNVILIGDIITTGETFNRTAEQALHMGANSVHGLFLAKTIHPDLPMRKKTTSQREIDDTILREEAEIMNRLSSLPANE